MKPLVCRIGSGFVPVVYHPERIAEYTRHKRFMRKAKATPEEAYAYAERVIRWRLSRLLPAQALSRAA